MHGDDGFTVNDRLTVYNRAALEISENCPASARDAIVKYYSLGWVKPVAYVHKSELMFNEIKGQKEIEIASNKSQNTDLALSPFIS